MISLSFISVFMTSCISWISSCLEDRSVISPSFIMFPMISRTALGDPSESDGTRVDPSSDLLGDMLST